MWVGAPPNPSGNRRLLHSRFHRTVTGALSLEAAKAMNFTGRDRLIADRLQREVIERLEFLNAVGLGYLRSTAPPHLLRRQGQRIRLATRSAYASAESSSSTSPPSASTSAKRAPHRRPRRPTRPRQFRPRRRARRRHHPHSRLRPRLRPGAGENGGELIAQGTLQEILNNPASLTAQYLARKLQIPVPKDPAPPPAVAHHRNRPREQPPEHHRLLPSRRHHLHHRRLRQRKIDPGQ